MHNNNNFICNYYFTLYDAIKKNLVLFTFILHTQLICLIVFVVSIVCTDNQSICALSIPLIHQGCRIAGANPSFYLRRSPGLQVYRRANTGSSSNRHTSYIYMDPNYPLIFNWSINNRIQERIVIKCLHVNEIPCWD